MSARFVSPYPNYDVLDKRDTPSWNPITRKVVEDRLSSVPPRRFLDEDHYAVLESVCARVLPQPERTHPIATAPWIDNKLREDRRDGTRFVELPVQREAWPLGLGAIDTEARWRFGAPFCRLPPTDQDNVLRAMQSGALASKAWPKEKAMRFFSGILLREIVGVYYAHPDAWSEIGFGGPASPRGYARLDADMRDPWEAESRTEEKGRDEQA